MQAGKDIKFFIHKDIWDVAAELNFTLDEKEVNIKSSQADKFDDKDDLLRKVIQSTILQPLEKT